MKKLVLSIAAIAMTFGAFAQAKEKVTHKHAPYISAGLNWAPKTANSFGVEAGTWGITSNTTFGVTYDFVPGDYTLSNGTVLKNYAAQWIGAKAYYTVHDEEKLCYMVYVAPKKCVNAHDGMDNELIEFGFNPYYKLNKNILLGVCIGNQAYGAGNSWNLFVNGGFTVLMPH